MEVDLEINKNIYFIFSQKGKESKIFNIEENENVKNVKIVKQIKSPNYSYSLYSMKISNTGNILLLFTNYEEKYIASMKFFKAYSDNFIYKIDFKPFNESLNNNIDQITLPYKEQFIIFKKNIVNENIDLFKYLLLSSLGFLLTSSLNNSKEDLVSKLNFEFDYFLYLFISSLFLNDLYPNENLLNLFFKYFNVDLIDIEKSFNKNDSNRFLIEEIIDKAAIESLNDYNKIYYDIKIKTETEKDDTINSKLDLLLCYYFFVYKKRIFIDFISDKNDRKTEVLSNLNKNRKLFKDFSSEIMDFDIFNEAENLLEIQNLLSLFPNLPELIKVMSTEELYIKIFYLSKQEGKIYNVYKIVKPKKDDNIELLKNNVEALINIAKEINGIIFTLSNDFFIGYCELFFEQNIKNIEIIFEIYKFYKSSIITQDENIEEELISYYYETGMYLIKIGKLNNNDIISFIIKINKLKKYVIQPEYIFNFVNITNDISFINNFLNDDLLPREECIKFVKGFFNKFKVLRDFINIEKWDLKNCKKSEILFICFDKLKELWIKESESKLPRDLCLFISKLFIYISTVTTTFIEELIDFEIRLNNKKIFLDIFSLILKNKKDNIPSALKNHIINYIDSNIIEDEPLSIYYKLLTLNTQDRIPFLLNNLKVIYAIKVEDFINYPNTISNRITLFINLYNEQCFHLEGKAIQKIDYYKESVASKDKLSTLKYKDAINICKNITFLSNLFLFFLPERRNDNDDYLIDALIINFYENCNHCKEQYNNLKLILNYWKHFFNYAKNVEINELNNFLNTLENTSISDFIELEVMIESFLFYVNEAITKDKLYNSFFFMGLYKNSALLFQETEQEDMFKYTLNRFYEIKNLGKNSEIDDLPYDLLNELTELVYKNNDRLEDELSFIKEYFQFENNANNFFDTNKIKRDFTNRVNKYKINNNLGEYEIEFDDDDFSLIKFNRNSNNLNLNNAKSRKSTTNKDEEGFTLFTDDGDDDDFSLLNNNQKESIKVISEKKIKEAEEIKDNNLIPESEKMELLKEIIQMSNDFYNIYHINNPSGDDIYEDNILYFQKFNIFFWDTFKNIHKYEILPEKEFYEDILLLMKKIFLSSVGINYFKKENNDRIIFLVYEFYEILEIYKRYHLIKKLQISNIIERILECKERANDEIKNTEALEHLLSEIEETLKGKNLFNLSTNILLIHEKINNDNEQFNKKVIDYILRDDNKHLLNEAIPLMDKIFNKEITSRIDLDEYNNNNITEFYNFSLNIIDKECNKSKDLEELILFYFESKLSKIIFSKNQKNFVEKNIYLNGSMKNYLRQCLNLLEKDSRNELNQENKKISILFSVAFVKCFLSNYIYYLRKKNQDLGNVDDINNEIITGYGNNPFRTSMKLYILKLFYNILGNYKEFIQFNFTNYQINYFQNEDIQNLKDEENNFAHNKIMYGFDNLFITLESKEFEEYINIEKNLIDLSSNNDNNLVSIINNTNNLDSFICAIINLFLSNYHNQNYFNSDEYKIISVCLIDNLNNNDFDKINNLAKNVLLLFIDKNKYENNIIKIERNVSYGNLTYNQLLALLFSFRYVINTLLNNNQNNFYYQLLSNGKKIIENKNDYFFYYNRDFSIFENREINHLTFTIIRFIILSHLYFSYLLKIIDINDINTIFNNENNARILYLLEEEFDLIKKIIELKGIRNIIIFMNYVFNDIKSIISNIEVINDENNIKNIELNIESKILKCLDNFNNYIDNYNKLISKTNIKDSKNEFKKIMFEDNEFYNDKNIDKKYKFMQYFTITNFSSLRDFKNQFFYLNNEKNNYPLINCILNNMEIMTVSSNLPYINSFINEVYNELALKIKKEDLEKKINALLNENILNKIDEFNRRINEINNLKGFNTNKINEINPNSKISEIINIKNNSIYNLFNKFIKIYNEFLTNTKIYKDNKSLLEPMIIQNASKDDYIYLSNDKDNNNDDMANINDNNCLSPIEKLENILSLYSKRNRYNNKILNVYNGSKIIYDFNQIETLLQKEYIYGKKPFLENQRTFIFSNEVFSGERNNLIQDLKTKYIQKDITEQSLKNEIDKFINDENKTNQIFIQIYTNIQYLLIHLVYAQNNYDSENIPLHYIAKTVQKNNYKINDLLFEFLNQYKGSIHINNFLFLYEKIEVKCFESLTRELCSEVKNKIDETNQKTIMEYFKNDQLLLSEETILNSVKKHILRYCIGDNQNIGEVKNKIQMGNILNREDLWEERIFKDERFKEEIKELEKINNENILMKYCLNKLFKIKSEQKEQKSEIVENKKKKGKRIKHKIRF